MAPLNAPSGVSRVEPSVIIPSGAYCPKALSGADMAIALMDTPPVAVRVEAEALVVRQSPEATATLAATHCATESSSPGHLPCLLHC